MDSHVNFGYSTVATAPSPATSGTSLVVATGTGTLFPTAPFNCTVWPAGSQPLKSTAEIIRVTAIVGDTFTIVRAQEGSTARSISVGDQIANTITVKIITDLETAVAALPQFAIQSVSAGTKVNTGPSVVFSNTNGVTFGGDGTNITASVNTNYQTPGAYLTTAMLSNAATISNVKVSAGISSNLVSAITFSNTNGVSFGYDGTNITASVQTNYLTTAMQSNAATISNIKVSAGASSSLVSALTFSNTNGVSFGYDGTNITASVQTNYQSAGAYLTTAMQSGQSSNFAGTGFTSTTTAGTAVVGTHNTAGLSLGVPVFLTTAMASNAATLSNFVVSAGTTKNSASGVTFSNTNGVSFGYDGTNITAAVATNYQSQGAYLTTAMLSNQSSNFAGTGFSSTTTAGVAVVGTHNTAGLSLAVPAFVTTNNLGFNISAGASSDNFNKAETLILSNSNGVSFGLAGSTITASVQTNYQSQGAYLTTAMQSGQSTAFAGTGFTSTTTAGTAIVGTHNAAGLSLGVPAFLTTAMASNAATLSNIKISAGTTSSNVSGVTFSNTNGISFGYDGTNITATVATNYQSQGAYLTTAMQSNAATLSNIKISAGTASSLVSAITFSNTNGVTFGYDGTNISASVNTNYQTPGAYLTTAMQSNAATLSNIKISAGTASSLVSALIFSNTNGVTFGYDGTNISASVQTNYQSAGAYLTTAMQSGQSSNFAGTGFSSTTTVGTAIVGTHNTAGLSLGVPAYLTTAMASNAATLSNIKISAGTTSSNVSGITFSNANGISFGYDGTNVTATVATNYQSQGAYLTTAMQSNAATLSNIKISAGTTSSNVSAMTFSNANGVSFGYDGANITASVQTALVIAAETAAGSAGTSGSTYSVTNINFVNGNGVSWSFNATGGNILQASVNTNYQAALIVQANANTASGFSKLAFVNSNGITWGLSNFTGQANVTASINPLILFSAGTTSNTVSAITFNNANGVSFGYDGTNITATVATNYLAAVPVSAGGAAGSVLGLTFNDTNGVSFLFAGHSLSASVQTNYAGIGFTSTTTAGTAIAGTNNTAGLSLAVPAFVTTNNLGFNISAGASSDNFNNSKTLVLSNSNGISFGLNGSTITAQNLVASQYDSPVYGTLAVTYPQLGQNTLYFQPFDIQGNLFANRINLYASVSTANSASSNATWSGGYTGRVALYSRAAAVSGTAAIASFWSFSYFLTINGSSNTLLGGLAPFSIVNSTSIGTVQFGNSSNVSNFMGGPRVIALPVSSTLLPGRYWLAYAFSTASAGVAGQYVHLSMLQHTHTAIGFAPFGTNAAYASTTTPTAGSYFNMYEGLGTYTATSAGFPGTVAMSTPPGIQAALTATRLFFNISGYPSGTNIL